LTEDSCLAKGMPSFQVVMSNHYYKSPALLSQFRMVLKDNSIFETPQENQLRLLLILYHCSTSASFMLPSLLPVLITNKLLYILISIILVSTKFPSKNSLLTNLLKLYFSQQLLKQFYFSHSDFVLSFPSLGNPANFPCIYSCYPYYFQ